MEQPVPSWASLQGGDPIFLGPTLVKTPKQISVLCYYTEQKHKIPCDEIACVAVTLSIEQQGLLVAGVSFSCFKLCQTNAKHRQ